MYSEIIQPSTPLFAPLVVLNYGTICIGIFLYAREFGATDMNPFQGLFWSYLAFSVIICTPMTFMWFGSGEGRKLQSFAMTGAFLVFPLVHKTKSSRSRPEIVLTLAPIDACRDNSLQHLTSDRSFSHECPRNLGCWIYFSRTGNGRDIYCMFFSQYAFFQDH